MRYTRLCFFLLLFIQRASYAQNNDAHLIDTLLHQIEGAQLKQDTKEFYAGMFNAYRECGGAPHNYQPDNNIFFTAVLALGLKNMLPYLNDPNRNIASNIIHNAATSYPYFKNRYGFPYYGFWPTNKPIMPHTYYFKYLKAVFGQGEDADDTVMILMTDDSTTDSTAKLLKQRMIRNSNLSGNNNIVSTYKKYRNIPAYSTWLGDHMTTDFDFGVHCNILCFMHQFNLLDAIQDTATENLLVDMVKSREYMKAPVYLSPYYVHSSILLYHLTRLMFEYKMPSLEIYKPQLIEDINSLLKTSYNVMDQIILRTCLLRLGVTPSALDIKTLDEFEKSNQNTFVFFQARAAFPYPTPFKQIFLNWSYIYYYFYCPDYNKMLWLEYLVLKQASKK
jgi:hypothetical protein